MVPLMEHLMGCRLDYQKEMLMVQLMAHQMDYRKEKYLVMQMAPWKDYQMVHHWDYHSEITLKPTSSLASSASTSFKVCIQCSRSGSTPLNALC